MRAFTGCLFLLCLYSVTAHAGETAQLSSGLCPAENAFSKDFVPARAFSDEHRQETRIGARQIQSSTDNISLFDGDVLIEQNNFVLQAQQVVFDADEQLLDINGDIRINTPTFQIQADKGHYKLKEKSGSFFNNQYRLIESNLQGRTQSLSLQDQHSVLLDTQFSSCPVSQQDWYLSMGKLDLNHQTKTGTASHASLWFKGIPIFYWPWLSFPIGDERRSGFLMPSLTDSSSRGTELVVPWYWNIAPNQDALFTPRYMSEHGSQLGSRYRYLNRNTSAQLDLEYLANDRQTQTDRYSLKLKQQSRLSDNSRFELIFNDLSDSQYFQDLGNSIYSKNTINVERKASLFHNSKRWSSSLTLQSFKTIDETISIDNRPYQRLPQVQINGSDRFSFQPGLNWSVDAEWVNFDHESSNKPVGKRADIYPRISWPLHGDSWFMTLSSGYRISQYDVTDSNGSTLPLATRKLSISSLDAGLIFERNLRNNSMIQTLEPRLFYLHVPFEDQSAIPLFDTKNISDFSFAQLFRENRFNGIDRIGDANQLTLALSSRFMDIEQGKELASLQLGQIFYNTPQKVALNGINTVTDKHSDVIAEASASIDAWKASATLQWNPRTRQTDKRLYQLGYAENNQRILNLSYRFRRNSSDESLNLEQTDISWRWPLGHNYALLARWNYSLTEERDIDTIFGLEYESCCWSLRLITQSYLNDANDNLYDNSIRIQLNFKGFGSISDRKTNDILKRAIIGYQPDN